MFAAVRHPDIEVLGVVPDGALESHRARGWYRVSDWVERPADLHLPDYEDVTTDLDAEPEPKPTKKSSPAKPANHDEEFQA